MPERYLFTLSLFILFNSLYAFADTTTASIHTLIITKDEDTYKFGLKNKDGKTIVPCKYDLIEAKFIEKTPYYWIYNEKKWGIIDDNGKFRLDIEWEYLYYGGKNLVLKKDGKWGLADNKFNIFLPPTYEKLESFNLVYKAQNSNVHWGILDSRGKEILAFNYLQLDDIGKNLLIVKTIDSLYGIWQIDSLGRRFLIPPLYNFISNRLYANDDLGYGWEKSNFLLIQKDSLFGIINKEGTFIIKPTYKYLTYKINKEIYTIPKEDEDKFIFYDNAKNALFQIDANTKHIGIDNSSNAYLFPNHTLLLIDTLGKITLANSIADITINHFSKSYHSGCMGTIEDIDYLPFKNQGHVFITTQSGKSGVINLSGEMIIDTIYDKLEYEGARYECKNKERYYMAQKNKTSDTLYFFENGNLIPNNLCIQSKLSNSMYIVENKNSEKYLVFNSYTLKKESHEWDYIKQNQSCNNQTFIFSQDKKYGISSLDTIIIPAKYPSIKPMLSGYCCLRFDSTYDFLNTDAKLVSFPFKLKSYLLVTDSTHFIAQKDKKFVIVNTEGKICSVEYDSILPHKYYRKIFYNDGKSAENGFYNLHDKRNIFWTIRDGKYGLIKSDGSILSQPLFTDIITDFVGYFNTVSDTSLNGWNSYSRIEIKGSYPNVAIIKVGEKFGAIGTDGKYLADPNYNNIRSLPVFLPFLTFSNDGPSDLEMSSSAKNILINNFLCEHILTDVEIPHIKKPTCSYVRRNWSFIDDIYTKCKNRGYFSSDKDFTNYMQVSSAYKNLFTIMDIAPHYNSNRATTLFYKLDSTSNEIIPISFRKLFATADTIGLIQLISSKILSMPLPLDYVINETNKTWYNYFFKPKYSTLNYILDYYGIIIITEDGLTFKTKHEIISPNFHPNQSFTISYTELTPFITPDGALWPLVSKQ